jgi:hypothetical protein
VNVGKWLVRADGRLRALPGDPSPGLPPPGEQRAPDPDPERVEAVTDTLAFGSGDD